MGLETLGTFIAALGGVLAQSAPYVVLGYAIAALLHEFVPVEALTRGFGRDPLSVVRATVAGLILPVCSCGVVPLGVGLRRSGAALGTVLAFLLAAPATSPVAILVAWNTIGPPLTLVWTAVIIGAALALGLVVNRWAPAEAATATPTPPASPASDGARPPLWRRIVGACRWAFFELGADVSVDLTAGLALAAALLTIVPPEWIARGLGPSLGPAAVLVALVVAIPAYTCTIPTIPVVRSLLLLGAAPGAALAFLIAGPATNLGELNVLRAQLGVRATLAFVAALIGAAITGAIAATLLLPVPDVTGFEAARELIATACCLPMPGVGDAPRPASPFAHVPAWHLPFAALLGATLAVGLVRRVRRWRGPGTPAPAAAGGAP